MICGGGIGTHKEATVATYERAASNIDMIYRKSPMARSDDSSPAPSILCELLAVDNLGLSATRKATA